MSTMTNPLNNKFIKIQQDYLYVVHLKAIMRQSLHMVRQAQEKRILWRVLDIICMMMKEALSLEQSRIFSGTFSRAKIKM
jgi:hypothetical protein